MPISNAAFVRSTIVLLIAGMIALLGIVGTSLWLVNKVQTYFNELVEVREVRSSAADLLSTLQDAETGQRGFVITGDASFREPYDDALRAVAERQQTLGERAERFPHYAERMPDIRRLVSEKLVELSQTVEDAEAGRTADAVAKVKTDRGRIIMNELRANLGDMMADADRRLEAGIADTLQIRCALLAGCDGRRCSARSPSSASWVAQPSWWANTPATCSPRAARSRP
jgi:CHASE3 domain sensor protein